MSLLLSLVLTPANAQVWVAPRRAGQSIVRFTEHDWQTMDLLVDAEIGGEKAGGVRMFFYETERETAERAAAHLETTYRRLCETFGYTPRKRFDYVLYGSYTEFLRTNVFPVQEGVLGVTSTMGLEMALPHFGDHETFLHTSTHELAHEFTIQKVRSAAKDADVTRDPLYGLPLWFVEGLAEFVAIGPIQGENAMRVRDLVTNPDLYTGHGLLGFWDDWPSYVLWTYQGGHARLTFLEETYGAGTIQRILSLSPAMVSEAGLAARIQTFAQLVEEVTGDKEERVAERFDAWVKRRAYAEWLASDQAFSEFEVVEDVRGVPLALDASPDGTLLAYRSLAPDTGRSRLYVVDPRPFGITRRIAADGRPGVESLHPIDPRNFDLGSDRVAFVAESRGRDDLVVRRLSHESTPRKVERRADALGEGVSKLPLKERTPEPNERVRIRTGERARYRLGPAGLSTAVSVALEPGGERVALIGQHRDGTRDVFLLTPTGQRTFALRALTDDVAGERDVSWGPEGIVYASDASADGRWQLFLVDADQGAPRRLTSTDRDHLSPTVLADGTVVFSSYEDDASQLFAFFDGEVVRLTDLATGVFEPATGPGDDLWGLVQHRGQLRPARIRSERMRALPDVATPAAPGPPFEFERLDLSAARPYQPLAPRNWGIDGGFAAVGAGPGGVYGQLFLSFSDRLRDHGLIVVAQAYGTPELTDALVLYLDQHARVTWGAGPFHALRFRIDQTLGAPVLFQSGERYYGLQGSLRLPIDRFLYAQLDPSIGGVSYFLFPDTELFLQDSVANGTGRDLLSVWNTNNTSPRLQTEATLRFGLDTTRWHYKTGPVAGSSLLFEASAGLQPLNDQQFGSLRVDGQTYVPIPLVSGGNVGLRATAATSGLGDYAVGYWLSSYDTLRAYHWGDPALLGRHYWFSNAELQVPLDLLVRLAVASSVEGVAGLDFGAVSDDLGALWDGRVLDGALGTNFVLGPLVLRLHFAHAIDIGAPLPVTRTPWVTNFSISWLSQ